MDLEAPVVEVPTTEVVPPVVEPDAPTEDEKQVEPRVFTQEEHERGIQERLAKEQRKHDREIRQTLERENERLRTQGAPKPVEPSGRPSRENYQDDISYIRADADWAAESKFNEKMTALEQKHRQESFQRQFEDVKSSHQKRVESLMKTNPEYDEVVMQNRDLQISPPMAEAIILLDNGPSVALYLGKNPNEATRISRLPAALAGIELGKISMKLEPTFAKTISSAPAPMKPVSSSKSISADLEGAKTQADFERIWDKLAGGGKRS